MKLPPSLLAAAIILSLSACKPSAETPSAEAGSATETTEVNATEAEANTTPAIEETTAPNVARDAASLTESNQCTFHLEGNDAMQFNVKNIDVPKSCAEFTLRLKHVGTMPVAAMGHNVVIAKTADISAVAAEGSAVQPDHVKEGDPRVIAHSRMVDGGQSSSATFDVSKIAAGGYSFFCTFPGHSGMMQGTLTLI